MKQNRIVNIIFFLILGMTCFAQISGVVIDKETKQPIPYVNIYVLNTKNGATSNIDGKFIINDYKTGNEVIITSIGYCSKIVRLYDTNNIIYLIPKTYEIQEFVVEPRKYKNELLVNVIKKNQVNTHFKTTRPAIVAKYFNFQPKYNDLKYLKNVKLITKSEISGAKFNLRLFYPNSTGEPGEDILAENIYVEVKKGERLITIDLSNKNISFPKNGFFVALEWLIVDTNKKEFNYTQTIDNKKVKTYSYDPEFGGILKEIYPNTWNYNGGVWRKGAALNIEKSGKKIKERYFDLAIAITLTD